LAGVRKETTLRFSQMLRKASARLKAASKPLSSVQLTFE
jgi:hypothetical protein